MRSFSLIKNIETSEGNKITLRPYEEIYFSSLVKMYDDYRPLASVQGLPPNEKVIRHKWVQDMISRGTNLLALNGERVIGQASFFSMPVNWVEFFIFIHQDFQRQGIGTAMTRYVIEWAKKEKMSAIWLSVERKNYVAVSLYRSVGFERFGSNGFELEMVFTLDNK